VEGAGHTKVDYGPVTTIHQAFPAAINFQTVCGAKVVSLPPRSGGGERLVVLHRNVQRFRGGLVFKAHRRLYHSTLGLRVINKKIRREGTWTP